jgi:hypothetical protein
MATGQRGCNSKIDNFGQHSNSDDSDMDKDYVASNDAIQPNNPEVN